jgi:hypothetical protein
MAAQLTDSWIPVQPNGMSDKGHSFLEFLRAFLANWLEAMSGSASVPFAIAAVFVTSTAQKIILVLASIFCVLLASYIVWQKERKRNNHLASELSDLFEKSKPKLAILFDKNDEFIRSYHPDRKPWLLIPVAIKNEGGIFLEDCRVRLRYDPPGYPKRPDGVIFGNPLSCKPFSLLPDDGRLINILAFDDPAFEPHENYLRIITFSEQEQGWIEQDFATPILPPGVHRVTVEAFSANTRRASIDLILTYSGGHWVVKEVSG